MQPPRRHLGRNLRFLLVVLLWSSLTADGLATFFTGDDLMNLYKIFTSEPGYLLSGFLRFWSSDFLRPLGNLAYLTLYGAFGFDPRPFRAAGFVILAANLCLGMCVLSRLLGSRERGALALLLIAYNARMNDLYLNFGTVYETLCFWFYYCALSWWMRIRSRSADPSMAEYAGTLLLYLLALCAKEMAVSLPVVVLGYELLLAPRLATLRQQVLAGVRHTIPWVVLTVVFLAGKLHGPESLIQSDAFRPSLSLSSYLLATTHYLNNLFLLDWCTPTRAAIALSATLGLSLAVRSSTVLFGWLLFFASLLPVSFIVARSGYVLYIGMIGFGTWVVAMLDCILGRGRWRATRTVLDGWPMFLLWACVACSIAFHFKPLSDEDVKPWSRANEHFYLSFLSTGIQLRPGDHVLLLDDAYDPDVYDPLFLLALASHDPTLEVHRARMPGRVLEPLERYDCVLDYVNDELTVLKARNRISGLAGIDARLGSRLPRE